MVTGAILSGGQGSRMGLEKGLAILAGRPLVLHMVEAMRGVVDDVIVAVAPGMTGRYSAVLGKGVLIAEDPQPGLGPLQGIVTAMSSSKRGLVLVAPCDTPFVRPQLCSLVVSSVGGKDGAVPMVGPYFEPLHGCYDSRRCLHAFKEALAMGRRRPADAFDGLDIVSIPETRLREVDPSLISFWNLNSPKDLAEAERILGR